MRALSQEKKIFKYQKDLTKQPVSYTATDLKSTQESDGEALTYRYSLMGNKKKQEEQKKKKNHKISHYREKNLTSIWSARTKR